MEVISSKIVNSNKAIYTYFIFATIIPLTLYIGLYVLHNKIIIWLGFFVGVVPLFFSERYLEYFTKKSVISFTFDKINLKLYERITNELIEEYDFEYEKIEYFSAYDATKDKGSYLIIKMKNKNSFSYRFLSNERNETTNLINKYIINYNLSKTKPSDRIKYIPGFFASKTGKISFFILSLIVIIATVIGLIFYGKSKPYLILPGIAIYLGIIFQRKNDLKMIERWNEKMKG